MPINLNKVFYTIFLFFLGIVVLQAQQIPIRNYTLIDGLPESNVKSIAEDEKGFVWFATQGGVSRFDGQNFTNFTTEHGLLSNNTNYIIIDKKGIIWVATRSGLSRFDGRKFKTYTKKDGLVGNDINTLYEDLQGNLWIGTGQGLSKFDGKKFTNYTTKNGLAHNVVWTITQDTQGDIWVGTDDGLSQIEGNKISSFTVEDGLPSNSINCLIIDSQNRLWIGTSEGLGQKKGEKFATLTRENGLPSNVIWELETTSQNKLWIATQVGAVKMDLVSGKIERQITQRTGLTSDYLNVVFLDSGGNLWLGSDNGVSKLSGEFFEVFTQAFFEQSVSVWSLLTDIEGNLWYGTTGGGVFKSDGDILTNYTIKDGLAGNFVKSIFQDSKGNIWFGTFEGVSRFDGKTFTSYSAEDGLSNNSVFAITEDNKGNLWFGTDKGISRFDGEEFKNFSTKDGLPDNYIRAALKDSKGNLWFGTYGGLVKYNGKKFEVFTQTNGLAHNLVLSILEDSKKNIWLATENGLCKLKPNAKNTQKNCFEVFGKAQGMQSQNIWLLTEDKEGNIWIGHRTGVERFNPNKNSFYHYGYVDGFSLVQTYPNAVTVDKKGNIWFGAINGLVKYNPSQDSRDTNPPKVHITSIELGGKAVDWKSLADSIDSYFLIPIAKEEGKAAIKLNYDQNHITFNFVGVYLSLSEKVKYRYKLEGFDDDWLPLTQKTSITYTNLKPGRYRFVVEAYNKDGVVSIKPAEFDFIIDYPYWEKWWFYLLQLFFFTLLIGASIYFNTKHRRSRITVVLAFITLLVLFEFLNVHLENYIEGYIQNIPLYKTLINVVVAVLFTPLEGVMRKYMNRVKTTEKRAPQHEAPQGAKGSVYRANKK